MLQSCLTLRPQSLQGPLSMGFSRQEYWSGLPFPTPGDLPDPGIEPASPVSPTLAGGFFTTVPPGKPCLNLLNLNILMYFISRCLSGKESACNAGDVSSGPGSRRSPGERNGNPLHCFAWEIQRRRSLAGYNLCGHKELDMTE